jgi:hypothetical protein
MKNNYLALLNNLHFFGYISNGYQAKKIYSTVDTASVLAYKVEEIVSMRFGNHNKILITRSIQLVM